MTRGFAIRTTRATGVSDAVAAKAQQLREQALDAERGAVVHEDEARRLRVRAEQLRRQANELDGGERC